MTEHSISVPSSATLTEATYKKTLTYRWIFLILILMIILISICFDFLLGPAGLSWSELVHALIDSQQTSPAIHTIVWEMRLPQALTACVVGLALGLAGAEMQTILNNPLASPFTLGLSSAAAFGASLAIVFNFSLPYIPDAWMISSNAFIFALLSAFLLDLIARISGMNASGVVLFGIALVFCFNALVSLIQFIASSESLQGLVLWTMGSLSAATWGKLAIMTLLFIIIFPFSMKNAWHLTAIRLGEERAMSFGIDVNRLRRMTLIRISLLSAISVSFVGTIGFIGLVAPHIARRLFGEDHRFYLPGSALIGAAILSLASIASKNIQPGIVIPVGIVTSLVGIPFFMAIIFRRQIN